MTKTPAKAVLFAAGALFLSGCASYRLPAVTAQEVNYRRTDPLGGTQITAKNVKSDEEKVSADEATWLTNYPWFSVSVTLKGYERKK